MFLVEQFYEIMWRAGRWGFITSHMGWSDSPGFDGLINSLVAEERSQPSTSRDLVWWSTKGYMSLTHNVELHREVNLPNKCHAQFKTPLINYWNWTIVTNAVAWVREDIPKQVKSLLHCCFSVHFQGPKHPLPSLSLLAAGAGTLSWHSDIWCLCRNTFLSCRKEFTGPLIIAGDSTDKYILAMVWSCIFPTFIVVSLHAHA